MASEYSFSLGITPKEYSPEEILSLPEILANHIGKHIVVCIDEFQQIAGLPDSYILADDIDYPFGNKLPLWIIGFLY